MLASIRKIVVLLTTTLAFGLSPHVKADYLLGVIDGSTDVIKIDPVTGQGVKVGNYGPKPDSSEDIVVDGQGNLVIVGYVSGINTNASLRTTFAKLDPVTFAPTILGTAFDYRFVEGMANVNGTLYGSASTVNSYAPDTSDHLMKIDLATNTFTEVGKFGPQFLNVEDLAYSPTKGLYGVDIGTLDPATNFQTFHTMPALIKIDPLTGVATKVADLPPSIVNLVPNPNNNLLSPYGPFMCGLDFAPDGTLFATTFPTHFGGESHLVKIDPDTGAVTDIGDIGFAGVDGIVYVRTVPEPSSVLLVGSGFMAIIAYGRRRRSRSRQ